MMDPNGRVPSRFNHLRQSFASSDRLLGALPEGPSIDNPSSASAADYEFNEDDIFATDLPRTPPSSSSSVTSVPQPPARPIQRSRSGMTTVEVSGILAALPEASGSNHPTHVFHHKSATLSTSVSSTASSSSSSGGASAASLSSSRAIPTAPKPPQERLPFASSSVGGGKYPQSAPVKVPVISSAMMNRRRKEFDLADVEDEEEEEEGEMLPPHEIVARSMAQSPMLSCSVLEGVGRTLKGRDLRQIVKGKLSCLDCGKDFDFSGIKILMKCDGGRKPAKTVTTDADGGFQAELPGGEKYSGNCLVKILGGPEQIYAQRRDMISKMVMSKTEPNTLTTSKPLTFSLSCPKPVGKSDAGSLIGSSKAANDTGSDGGIGMGFPPASDFFPFLPIIGIP